MMALAQRTGGELVRQRWLVLALSLFFAAVSCQALAKITHGETLARSAFLRWRTQLQDLDEGANVWDRYAFPNPPIMALLLKPFFELPPLLGATLWFYSKCVLTILTLLAVFSLLDRAEYSCPLWGKLLALGLSLRPIEGDLVHGNVNLFILFLVVASLYLFCHHHDYPAGLLLGLAIACKLTPALFIVYFAWKRAWKLLMGTLLGLAIFILAVPGVGFGWSNNLAYLQSWHQHMVAPYAAGQVTSEHKNQSLPGLLHRLLCDEASFSDYIGTEKIVLETHNVMSLERSTVQGIVLGCMVIFFLLLAWCCGTETKDRFSWRLLAEFSIVVLGMLLFCERTWKHHAVTLLLPFSVAAYGLAAPAFGRGVRWYLGVALAFSGMLMLTTSNGHMETHARWGKLAQVYGAYTWVFLLLLSAMLVMLSRPRDVGSVPDQK